MALAALAAVAVLASCGGGDSADTTPATTPASTARTPAQGEATEAVTAAFDRLGSTSFRTALQQTIEYDVEEGPSELGTALSAASGVTRSRIAAESDRRIRAVVRTPQIDRPITVISYDGEIFVQLDPTDARRLTGSLGEAFGRLADVGAQELGAALEDVRDEGPATVAGRPAERYSAELSQAFIDDLTSDVLDSAGIDPSEVDVDITAERIALYLSPDGSLARQTQRLMSRIDLSEAVGEDAVIVQTGGTDQVFSDYGAPIVVEEPVSSGEISDPTELGRALLE